MGYTYRVGPTCILIYLFISTIVCTNLLVLQLTTRGGMYVAFSLLFIDIMPVINLI